MEVVDITAFTLFFAFDFALEHMIIDYLCRRFRTLG